MFSIEFWQSFSRELVTLFIAAALILLMVGPFIAHERRWRKRRPNIDQELSDVDDDLRAKGL